MSDISLEYNALRSEILKRMEFRQQQISIALTIAGVFLGIGTTTNAVSLVYPPLASFIAIGWAQNDLRIAEIAAYIRTQLEPANPNLNWETYSQNRRETEPWRGWLFTPFAHTGLLVLTQLLAIGIGLFRFTATPLEWVLIAVDVISILTVVLVMTQRRSNSKLGAKAKK